MILAQIVPKLHNCVKREFLRKTDHSKICQSIVSHHGKIFQKKAYGRSQDIRSNNFRANWTQIVLLRENEIF